MAKIVDLKSMGILQDVKELKRKKGKADAAAIGTIRREGKKKLIEYKAQREDISKSRSNVEGVLQSKRNTINQLSERYAKMGPTEKVASDIPSRIKRLEKGGSSAVKEYQKLGREETKLKVKTALTKADTAAGVALERFGALAKSAANQRVISRSVMKKGKMTVQVPEYKAPSVLGDENRFFKGELNKEKRSLFFS